MLFFSTNYEHQAKPRARFFQRRKTFFRHKPPAQPVKKPVCIMHPENAPRMIHDKGFPKEFLLYNYVGATLELLPSVGPEGHMIRRPALVAKLALKYRSDDDSVGIEMEMTASIKDLRKAKHPDAESIAAALAMFYEEKVHRKEPIAWPPRHAKKNTEVACFPTDTAKQSASC